MLTQEGLETGGLHVDIITCFYAATSRLHLLLLAQASIALLNHSLNNPGRLPCTQHVLSFDLRTAHRCSLRQPRRRHLGGSPIANKKFG